MYDFNKGFTAHWFEPSENIASEASIYNQESELVATLKAINTEGKFQVDLSGDAEGKLMIHIKNKVKTFELTNGSQTFEI